MSTRGSTWLDTDTTPGWVGESRPCPFCTISPSICGCPEGERIMDEAHIIRGMD